MGTLASGYCYLVHWDDYDTFYTRFNAAYSSKMGGLELSFNIDIAQILQYAYNLFASMSPMVYLYVGAAFALFIIAKLIAVLTEKRSS